MKYFITGATGFIGGKLAKRLVSEGHTIHALVRDTEKAKELLVRYFNRAAIKETNGDIQITDSSQQPRFSPIYPLELTVSIDGLAGIIPGQCFMIENIPKMYRDVGIFLIVEVSEEIDSSNWQTTLRSFFKVTKLKRD